MTVLRNQFFLALLAIAGSVLFDSSQAQTSDSRENIITIELLVPAAIPVSIYDPKLEVLPEELKYVIRNQTGEEILRVDGFLYLISKAGEIKMTAEWTEVDIKAHERKKSEYNYLFLSEEQGKSVEEMDSKDRMILAVHEVKTKSGTWVIDNNELEAAVRYKAAGKRFRVPKVEREYPLRIGQRDKAELFRISFEYLFRDREILEYLGIQDKKNIILSTQEIGTYAIPSISGLNVIQLNPEEIQQKANREGRVVFMAYSPAEVEGSRVHVGFYSYDRVREGTMTVCWGGEFTLEYRRRSGKWEYLRGSGGRF